MTGARFDARYGRGLVGPLQIDVPDRLPGGLWGPPPATGLVSWDMQGAPLSGFGPVDRNLAGLMRAEWPIPVRWELQIALALTHISGGNGEHIWSPGDFRLFLQIRSYVESASATQDVVLEYGPGIYPLIQNIVWSENKPLTYALTAQRIEAEVLSIEDNGIGGQAIHGATYRWAVAFLPALTSAGWPA